MRVFWLFLLMGYGSARAQIPAATVDEALAGMAQRAGVVFAGQVISVDRQAAAGVVEVRFAVSEAVLGCTAGSVYVLREWGGLWSGQAERYRVGRPLLVMFYAAGPGGLSSPVDGQSGVMPVAGGNVDLRWVAASGVWASGSQQTLPVRPGPVHSGPVHSGPVRTFARESEPEMLQTGNLAAVMQLLRGAVGAPVVHPILRPIAGGPPHVER